MSRRAKSGGFCQKHMRAAVATFCNCVIATLQTELLSTFITHYHQTVMYYCASERYGDVGEQIGQTKLARCSAASKLRASTAAVYV